MSKQEYLAEDKKLMDKITKSSGEYTDRFIRLNDYY